MLRFVSGRASSGKSYEICRRIAECVRSGGSPVLIIPEQFSFESEKRILSLLGDRDAQKVKVLSFTRLCDEVESIYGFSSAELSDSERIIIMTAALKNVREKLKHFGRYSLSSGLSKLMLNTVGEFVLNGISPADIFQAFDSMDDSVLSRKLYDTAVIFAEYEEICAVKLSGYKDRLDNLYDILESKPYFSGKSVFIDSFSGFTGQQYKIIDRILAGAEDVTVSFCDCAQMVGKYSIFSNIKKAKGRIRDIADRHGVKFCDDTVLPGGRYVSEKMAAVEEYMCFGKTDKTYDNALTVCFAQTVYDEAVFVARNIRRIVREQGARYSDFVVIARNAEEYEQVLSVAFRKNGIRCFSDKRLPLISFPPASAAMAALDLNSGITTEKLLRFHKCGVSFLSEAEISELENYVYMWNIDGNMWKTEWNMDPGGIDNKTKESEIGGAIEHINYLRRAALAPVTDFCDNFNGTPRDMARAVVKLLESAEKEFSVIAKGYKQSGRTEFSDCIITAYSKVMKILNSLVNCLDKNANSAEFKEAFRNCVNIESVGVIPQMVDEVVFGSAERIQPSRPQYVFILGANSGVFPRAPKANGVFAGNEIAKLNSLGIDIPDCSVNSAVDEDLLVYNCVCCANREVFISYNSKNGEMSYFVKSLVERFNITVQKEPEKLSAGNLPETADDTFVRLCRSKRGSIDYYTAKAVLEGIPEYAGRIENIDANGERPKFTVDGDLAKKLAGRKISLSASRFDTYSKCPFMYFCKYALGVKSTAPVSFNNMQSGTLLHYVLQRFVEETKGKEPCDVSAVTERLVNEYLDSFAGYRDAETPHLKLMVYEMKETLKYLCGRLLEEFRQSDFKPDKCELVIGPDGDIPPLELPVDGDTSVVVTGAVDRLDRYSSYVRVIDYKSGKREFKIPDVLAGLNMQMLIYLYAVCRDENYGGDPAGVFYMKAAMPDEDKPASRRMNGFMPETEELITAMDKTKTGEFIPFTSSRASKTGATEEDFRDIFKFTELKLTQAGRDIASGRFNAVPIDGRDKKACEYCEYSSICRIEDEKPQRVENYTGPQVISEIKRQVDGNGD